MAPLDRSAPAAPQVERPRLVRTPEEQAATDREIVALDAMTPEEHEAGIATWQAFFDSLPEEWRESFDEPWQQVDTVR